MNAMGEEKWRDEFDEKKEILITNTRKLKVIGPKRTVRNWEEK